MSGGDWKDFYKAIEQGDLDLVQFHVKNGIDINYQHPEILVTPLVTAIKNGNSDIAMLLLKNGADPWLESYYDSLNAVEACLQFKRKDILSFIQELGYVIDMKTKLKFFVQSLLRF